MKLRDSRDAKQDFIHYGLSDRHCNPPHRGKHVCVRLAGEGGVEGCRGHGVQEGGCNLRVHLRGSVDGRLQCVRGQGAGVRLGGLQARDGGVSACELGGQLSGGHDAQALASLVSTSSGVILAAMSRECWSTTVLRP